MEEVNHATHPTAHCGALAPLECNPFDLPTPPADHKNVAVSPGKVAACPCPRRSECHYVAGPSDTVGGLEWLP